MRFIPLRFNHGDGTCKISWYVWKISWCMAMKISWYLWKISWYLAMEISWYLWKISWYPWDDMKISRSLPMSDRRSNLCTCVPNTFPLSCIDALCFDARGKEECREWSSVGPSRAVWRAPLLARPRAPMRALLPGAGGARAPARARARTVPGLGSVHSVRLPNQPRGTPLVQNNSASSRGRILLPFPFLELTKTGFAIKPP